jgi:hypothetical protein
MADDQGSGSYDATAGLDNTVYVPAPSLPPMYPPPPVVQTALPSAGIPNYVSQGVYYDNSQSQMTQMRAGYGDMPLIAMRGMQTVGSGAAQGMGDMFSAIGAQIAPITYTPPARVLTDFSGRYVQNTGFMSDIKTLAGFGGSMRSSYAGDIHYNAAADLGERTAAGVFGAASGLAGLAGGEIGASLAGGGLMGGLVGGIGGYMAVGHVADQIAKAVEQRREIAGYLETTSDRYITAGSAVSDPRRGAGFSRGARQEVTNFIREMDLKDPLLDTADLTRILKESTQQGLFSGVGGMDDFKKRFKDITENVKVVAKTLHSTLEEGIKTIHDLRAIGVSPEQAGAVTRAASAYGLASGRSAGEMMNIGLQGAELFRGTGVSMQIGFESNIMNMASIRSARDAKLLSDEAIAQAGGEEALAQRMTASSMGFAQSTQGRGMMSMFFNPAAGGSGFNAGAFGATAGAGGGDFYANMMQGARNMAAGGPAGMFKFQANQEKMFSEMGKMYGGQGLELAQDTMIMMQASTFAKQFGGSTEDAYRAIALRSGQSTSQVDASLARMKNADKEFADKQAAIQANLAKAQADEANANRFIPRTISRVEKAFTGAYDLAAKPISSLYDASAEVALSADDWLSGTIRVDLRREDAALVGAASRAAKSGGALNAVDLDTGGGIFDPTFGKGLTNILGRGANAKIFGVSDLGAKKGRNISLGGGKFISGSELQAAQSRASILAMTDTEIDAERERLATGIETVQRAVVSTVGTERSVAGARDLNDLSTRVFQKEFSKLTRDEIIELRATTGKTRSDLWGSVQDDAKQIMSANAAAHVASLKQGKEELDAARSKFAQQLNNRMRMVDPGHEIFGGVSAADITPEVLASVSAVQSAKGKGEKDRAELALKSVLSNAKPELQTPEVYKQLINMKTGVSGGALASANDASVSLFLEQAKHGRDLIAGNLERELGGIKEKLSGKDADASRALLANVKAGTYENISPEQMKIAEMTPSAGLFKRVKEIDRAIAETKEGDANGLINALSGLHVAPAQAGQIVAGYKEGGTSQATAVANSLFQFETSAKGGVATSGAGGPAGTGAGTAEQAAATQTGINQEVLIILRALAGRLK